MFSFCLLIYAISALKNTFSKKETNYLFILRYLSYFLFGFTLLVILNAWAVRRMKPKWLIHGCLCKLAFGDERLRECSDFYTTLKQQHLFFITCKYIVCTIYQFHIGFLPILKLFSFIILFKLENELCMPVLLWFTKYRNVPLTERSQVKVRQLLKCI